MVEAVRFYPTHFKEFGENHLTPEVVYFVTDPGFDLYMEGQQKINQFFTAFVRISLGWTSHCLRGRCTLDSRLQALNG